MEKFKSATNVLNTSCLDDGVQNIAKKYANEVYKTIDNTGDNDDKYDLSLRRELAKKLKAKYISQFNDGIALVKSRDGKYFFINKNGDNIMCEIFDYAEEFDKDGIALVLRREGTYHFINRRGESITKKGFDYAESFDKSGVAKVLRNERIFYIGKDGREVF